MVEGVLYGLGFKDSGRKVEDFEFRGLGNNLKAFPSRGCRGFSVSA